MRDLIRFEKFAAGFDELAVLTNVTMTIAETGITCLMGPGGVGKTTLLRTLARLNDSFPSYWFSGELTFDGHDYLRTISVENSAPLVRLLAQKAKLHTASVVDNLVEVGSDETLSDRNEKQERAKQVLRKYGLYDEYSGSLDEPVRSLSIGKQRILTLIRLASQRPKCLLLDEPLRDLTPEDEATIVQLLLQIKRECAILMVTHNQRYARDIGDQICLLTAGTVVASGRCPAFFESPPNDLAKTFVTCGNVWPSNLDNAANTMDSDEDQGHGEPGRSESTNLKSERTVLPPIGMHWIIQDKLGSMQKPGLLRDLDADLAGLEGLGARTLVTLTQSCLDQDKLAEYGIRTIHFPIVDMSVPDVSHILQLCQQISSGIDSDDVLIVHCKAGLGRTGTVLACTLVYRGASAVDAINTIRLKNANYIQTDEQAEFVSEFERHLDARNLGIGQDTLAGVNNTNRD